MRSPVRISFAGGGTDLPSYYRSYGGAVLSTTINKYFYTVLRKRSDERVQVISSDLRAIETWDDITRMKFEGSDLEIPLAVLKHLGCNISVDLFLASEIPPGTGLGSSASVCVSVLKAVTSYLNIPLSRYELAEKAFYIATEMLKKPVGKQDEYATAFGALNYITFYPDGNVEVEPLSISPEVMQEFSANLMLFFTGAAHNSWKILSIQNESTRQHTRPVVDALSEVKQAADKMRHALLCGSLYEFGELLDSAWQSKKRISGEISNSRIDELYSIARNHGAIGGKITGAGGGGFLLLYCERDCQQAVRDAFAKMHVRELTFEFDAQGAQVIVDDPFIDGDANGGVLWNYVSVESGE